MNSNNYDNKTIFPAVDGIDNNINDKTPSKFRRFINMIAVPLLAGVISWAIFNLVIIIMLVPTGSMEPQIASGSLCFGNRLAFIKAVPEKGDVVVFKNKEAGSLMVKRVIGLPGDEITFKNNTLFINGTEIVPEDYLNEVPSYIDAEFLVPEGHIFLMGDNRNGSLDSRFWENPYIAIDEVIGEYLTGFKLPW